MSAVVPVSRSGEIATASNGQRARQPCYRSAFPGARTLGSVDSMPLYLTRSLQSAGLHLKIKSVLIVVDASGSTLLSFASGADIVGEARLLMTCCARCISRWVSCSARALRLSPLCRPFGDTQTEHSHIGIGVAVHFHHSDKATWTN